MTDIEETRKKENERKTKMRHIVNLYRKFINKFHTKTYNDLIAKELDNQSSKGSLILLHGDWGSGKTYRWKHTISKQIKNKEAIYISLFGMTSVSDIKKEIYNTYIDKVLKFSWKKIFSCLLYLFTIGTFVLYVLLASNVYIIEKLNTLIKNAPKDDKIKEILYGIFSIDNTDFVLKIGIFICLIYVITHRKTILLYFLNKYVGINSNTIQVNKIYNPKNTVFCFDDFERITDKAQGDEFLGYFNTLSKIYNYSILLIANKNVILNNANKVNLNNDLNTVNNNEKETNKTNIDYLIKYQEKLFDIMFIHDSNTNFTHLLSNISSNSDLCEYLTSIRTQLDLAKQNIKEYKPEEHVYISMASNNLRLFNKIIQNMDIIYKNISQEELIEEGNHKQVINFVGFMTIAIEVGKYKDTCEYCQHYDGYSFTTIFNNDNLKDFIHIFFDNYFYNYESTYTLIYKGEISDELKKELLPSKYSSVTDFEKKVISFNEQRINYYSSNELKQILEELDTIITQSDKLFSSLKNLYTTLGTYIVILSLVGHNLLTYEKTKKYIESHISKFIKNCNTEYLPDYKATYEYSPTKDNIPIYNYLNDFIFDETIKAQKEKIDSGNNLVEYCINTNLDSDSNKYNAKIISLVLVANLEITKLKHLLTTDYKTFQSLLNISIHFDCSLEVYSRICHVLNLPYTSYKRLLIILIYLLRQQKVKNGIYSIENINYKYALKELSKKIKTEIYLLKNIK